MTDEEISKSKGVWKFGWKRRFSSILMKRRQKKMVASTVRAQKLKKQKRFHKFFQCFFGHFSVPIKRKNPFFIVIKRNESKKSNQLTKKEITPLDKSDQGSFLETLYETASLQSEKSYYSISPKEHENAVHKFFGSIQSIESTPLHHNLNTHELNNSGNLTESAGLCEEKLQSASILLPNASPLVKHKLTDDLCQVKECHTINLENETPKYDECNNIGLKNEKLLATLAINEAIELGKACCGYWKTITERSESLDAHYRALGINAIKRSIMNRLCFCLTLFLEKNDTILHCLVHTPFGVRHMRNDLLGNEIEDIDVDMGAWKGVTDVSSDCVPTLNNNMPFRVLRQIRKSDKLGLCIETRSVLPDEENGKIMYFSVTLHPRSAPESPLKAIRIFRSIERIQ
jgi:hypothetical protein